MEAFVYCWTDHLKNMLYVGSHKGSTDDGYICSSKLMLEQYKKRPGDFIRQIIAHGTEEQVRTLEKKILESSNAMNDPQFYNMSTNGGYFRLKGHTEKTKEKMKGPKSDIAKRNMSIAKKGRLPKNLNKLHSKEVKAKAKEKAKEAITILGAWNKGKTGIYSPEVLKMMSISAKKKDFRKRKQTRISNGVISFWTIRNACEVTNLCYESIKKYCDNNLYGWYYINN